MHSGGGPANFCTRWGLPWLGGHSVASVSVMPSGGAGSSAGAAVVVVESDVATVVVVPSAVSSSPPVSATTTPMTTSTARTLPTMVIDRRRRAFCSTLCRASSTRLRRSFWRACFSALVPTAAERSEPAAMTCARRDVG